MIKPFWQSVTGQPITLISFHKDLLKLHKGSKRRKVETKKSGGKMWYKFTIDYSSE